MEDARGAYDKFAPIYDQFNHLNDYELWTSVLLAELEKHGIRKGRLLDVGCGTGRAFEPMLNRGWEVQGCDLSEGMLAEAGRKFGETVELAVADVRDLPVFGEFELVWALNDVVNYLTGEGELERALTGMCANLAPGGLLLFDANSLGLFQSSFSSGISEAMSSGPWSWHGLAEEVVPGGTYEAQVSGDGVEMHVHRQRHFPVTEMVAKMEAAGLEPVATVGQQEVDSQILLTSPPDEMRDYKVVYIGRQSSEK